LVTLDDSPLVSQNILLSLTKVAAKQEPSHASNVTHPDHVKAQIKEWAAADRVSPTDYILSIMHEQGNDKTARPLFHQAALRVSAESAEPVMVAPDNLVAIIIDADTHGIIVRASQASGLSIVETVSRLAAAAA
jgi:hypothetical protein